jgi:GR25 family glycosyltransferase involved in LPS biosynthesis
MFPCSHRLHWGHGLLLVLALVTLYNVDLTRPAVRARLAYVSFWQSSAAADFKTYESTLGVAADIYVANLPRREDRRHNMTVLAEALGARFTFVDAVDSDSEEIQNILDHVRLYRTHSEPTEFAWPASDAPITPLDWTGPLPEGTVLDNSVPLTCNEFDDSPRPYSPTMKDAFILSKKKIACYESHLRLLRRIAASPGSRSWSTGRESHVRAADVAIILEDDIDVEQDFRERLQGLWTTLPKTWDMVFFGMHYMS